MTRWGATIAALALTVVLAGCGGGTSPDLSGVAQAAQKAEDAGTASFELTFDAPAQAQSPGASFTAEGAIDYERDRFRMTMDLGSLGDLFGPTGQDAGTFDMVVDGNVAYMRFPLLAGLVGAGKPWLKMDLERLASQAGTDLGQLGELDQADPSQALAYLQGAGEFDEVGTEDVRGVETTRYAGTIDLRKALDEAPADQRDQLEQLLESGGVGELPAEAWIDGDGYLRRFTLDFSGIGGSAAEFSLAMELFDFGEPVELDIPPDDQVTDITELATKGDLGG